jgi:hypothetical protein
MTSWSASVMNTDPRGGARRGGAGPFSGVGALGETVLDALLAAGMLLALETQLRFGDGSFGPGEAFIGLWIAVHGARLILSERVPGGRAPVTFAAFWAVFCIGLCLGLIAIVVRAEPTPWQLVIHDTIAYAIAASLCLLLTTMRDRARRMRRLQWMIVVSGALSLVAQILSALVPIPIPGLDPWYWDRMRGWSSNPNQYALLCLLLGLLAMTLVEEARSLAAKSVAFACMCVVLGGGLLGKSNAYSAVTAATVSLFLLIKLFQAIARLDRRQGRIMPAAVMVAAGLAYAGCLLAPAIDHLAVTGEVRGAMLRDPKKEDRQVGQRVALWKQALERGASAWMLGLGPGPHLEIPHEVAVGHNGGPIKLIKLQHPQVELAANFEAHNTFLDIFVQGGLLATGAFALLYLMCLTSTWREGRGGLFALLVGLAAFGMFHFVARHPMVWFVFALALVGPSGGQRFGLSRPGPRSKDARSKDARSKDDWAWTHT